jgi:hypothetical protein
MLPPRSQKLVNATPLHELERGVKGCIEFTVYQDGHAGIAVSRIEGKPPSRRIVQSDSLPLNDLSELRNHVLAVLEHVATSAESDFFKGQFLSASDLTQEQESARSKRWSIEELRSELGRFEDELRDAGLEESSIRTYVDRSKVFLRWLVGEYRPMSAV